MPEKSTVFARRFFALLHYIILVFIFRAVLRRNVGIVFAGPACMVADDPPGAPRARRPAICAGAPHVFLCNAVALVPLLLIRCNVGEAVRRYGRSRCRCCVWAQLRAWFAVMSACRNYGRDCYAVRVCSALPALVRSCARALVRACLRAHTLGDFSRASPLLLTPESRFFRKKGIPERHKNKNLHYNTKSY